jgi:predicted Rdx family selenoprotein
MVSIAVEYCAPCRLGEEAVATRRALADRLRKYDQVEAVSLSPSPEERFRICVDGESVWRVDPDEGIDPMEAVAAARSRLVD